MHANHPTGVEAIDSLLEPLGFSEARLFRETTPEAGVAKVADLAWNLGVEDRQPVLVFSGGVSKEGFVHSLLTHATGVPLEDIRRGSLDETAMARLTDAAGRAYEAPIIVDDRADLTPDAFMETVEDTEAKEGDLILLFRRDGWVVVSARRGGLPALEDQPAPQGS